MAEFFFDLQQFATVADGTVTLDANETYTLDGVDYTADANGAVLKSETTDNGDGTYTATAITGITSGTVSASLEGKSDPAINFVGDTAFDFNCAENNGALNVKKGRSSLNYTTGAVTYYADKLDIPQGTVGFAGTLMHFLPFNVTMTVPASGIVETLDGSGGATFTAGDTVNLSLTFPEGVAENLEALKPYLPTILQERGIEITEAQVDTLYNLILPIVQDSLELNFTGAINYTRSPTSISFGENTTTDVIIGERTISFETVDGAAGIGFTFADGMLTITPGDNDGSLNITAKNGDIKTFAGNVEISGGSIAVDVFNQNISVTAGTTTTISTPGQRSLAISAEQSTGFDFAIGDDGTITLTSADSNPLNFQIKNGDVVILDRDIAITGSVVIGTDDKSFTVTQGTALTVTGEATDTSVTTTITATDDAGITFAVDDNGVFTLTPGEDDGSLNITRKRDGTTLLFDYDLNVSGGSMSFDPTSGEFTVAEGTTLEITNNRSGAQTTIAVEGADASCTLTPDSDGNLTLNVESGDGKLHVVNTNGDGTTLLENVVEFSGKITFDATNNTFTASNGTTLAVAFDNIELTATVNGDAGISINADSSKITITPGEGDGSIDLKLTNGDTTIFDGNLAVSGGGIAIDFPTQTITFDKGVAATITVGNRAFTFSLPNGAEQRIVIDDEGKLNLTFEDSEPLHINYTNGTTTIFDADITIDGKVVFVPNTGTLSVIKGTTATIEFANGRTIEFTATDDAGVTASIDDDGKITLTPNEDNGEIHIAITDGDTVREMDVELTGAIVFDAANQKIYAEKGTTLSISNNQVDIVTEISVDDDAGFTFALDDGKVIITPEDGDGKLTFTRIRDGGERMFSADIEISGGSIVFDSSNNSLTVTAGTTTAITAGDYTVELTVTDEAGVTIKVNDDGKLVVSAEEGDGELAFTLKKGDTVLRSGSIEFVGSLELDPNNQTVGVTKDTSLTFTLGNYKYSITANADASIALSEDTGAITVTAPDGDGSLDLKLTKGDETIFAGNVEFTGSFTVDPVNQKISLSDDSQTKITVGDYTVALEATDEASVGFALGDGTITLSAEEGDGKIFLRLEKDGTPLFMGGIEFDGEVTLDVANQKISVAKDTSLTFDRFGSATTIKALDEAGFTISNDGGKLTITPDTGDGKLQITRTQDDNTVTAELEINGSIVLDTASNALSLTQGTTIEATVNDYTVKVTANDANGIEFSLEDGYFVITPQEDGGSVNVTVTNGDNVLLDNTISLSDGSIKLDADGQKISVTGGTKLSLAQDETTINITAKDDVVLSIVDNRPAIDSDNQPPDFDPDNPPAPPDGSSTPPIFFKIENDSASFEVAVERDGTELFNSTVTVGGTLSYRASTNTFALVSSGDSEFSDTESYIETTTGDYTFKAGTDGETAVNSLSIGDDGKITVTFPNDEHNGLKVTATKSGEELFSGHVNIDGDIVYDTVANAIAIPADTTTTITVGEYSVVLSVTDEAGFTIDAGSGKITLTPGDGDGKLNTVIYNSDGDIIFGGTVEVANGSIVYDALNRAISVTKGTTTTVTIGEREIALTANDDAGVNIGLGDDGKLTLTPQDGDGSIDVTYSVDGQIAFANNVEISGGSITFDASNNSVGLTKGTTITLSNFSGTDGDSVSVTALDDASIAISAADGGVRIAPDSGDGDLQLSVTHDGFTRTATLGIEGAIVYQRGGNISLEDGTTVNLGWLNTEGVNIYNLKLTSRGSSGSIAFDAEKGLGVTSDDDKLDLEISSPFAESSMKFEGIQGTLWYNSGKVTLTEGTSFKSTGIFQSGDFNVAFEAVDGDVYVEFYTNYFIYGAGTGTFKHTITAPDGTTDTININEGSLKVEHDTDGFTIIEGSDITISANSTSVKLPPFTTSEAGEYTINGHKLTTLTEGVQLISTSNGMVLASNEDVTCDGMTFTGGNVTLTADGGHIIGAGVSVADFDPDNSIVLTEAGSVTVDGKTFELIKDSSLGVTITGAEDGFIVGSRESEDGSTFLEKFSAAGDSIYRVQASSEGLENVIDISAPVTINGGATEDGKSVGQYFYIGTETEGDFTIGERAYNIAGDSLVTLETNFENDEGYISGADGLEGTIRGDFTAYPVTVNGGEPIIVHGDTDIAIAVNENGLELFNVSDGASIHALGDASKVNGIGIQVEGNFDYVSASDEILFVHGASDATVTTDAPEKIWVQMTGESMTVNDNELKLAGDKDGIWFSNKEIVGLDEGASLTVGEAGTYSTDVVELEAQAGDVIVGLGGEDAYIYDENNPLITKQSTTEELVARFNPDETFVVGSESRGRINLELDGDDLVIVEDTPAWVNINTSSGDDTIVSQGDHVNINLGDGDTWLYVTGGKVTLDGYDQSTDTGFGTNYTDIAAAIERGSIQLGDGKITLGSAKVDMGGNDLINFYNRDGELQKVGYVAEGDALDASDETSDLLLFAENYSTVNSGSGDDTIKAGAGAVIDAGAGDNFIELAAEDDRYERDKGAVVDINDGDNTIENFKAGFDYESDAVSVETSGLSCFFDGADITVQTADGDTTVLEDVADNADFAQIKIVDGTTYNAAIAQEGEFIDVTDDKTDVYIGENSGVDFSGYSGQVLIDLDDKRGTIGKTSAQFYGINQLIGGDGITTLIGSSGDETITAGTGRASIWGNWGNDLMIGNTSADKKAGTEFFMFADDGHDTIDHFEFLTAQNSLTADRIYVGTSDINSATLNGDDVVINFDGSSDLTLTDAAGKNIQISDMIAKVDTDVEFDGIANTYIATDSNAELTVADSLTSAEIWLNNSRDAKFYGDIRTIDASNVDGKTTLGGNDLDNTIIAGEGDASLWGSGGNDLLVGGDGHNTFFYLLGNGNDTITGTNTDDELALSDITLDQISETSVTENGASIKFTDGGSLTIEGTADVTAVLADGTHYTANHAQKEWVAK